MKIFLDTNILVDLLADRPPFTQEAVKLIEVSFEKNLELYTSTHVLATVHYVLKKYVSDQELRQTILELTEMIRVIDVSFFVLKKALESTHRDFEDGLQISSAESIPEMDYILTRNLKDFKTSSIPAISTEELLRKISK